ncbi:MAG: hypothetical protein FWE23_07635 [Chitinivibrionia bacterium]|nr:hypothetical protein [Chitinivibrionia bacterium]
MKTIFLSQIDPQNQMPLESELFERAKLSDEIILLIYSWNGDVISTGKLQKHLKIDREKCKKDGVKIVERITGGRAVLHSNDICYSISIPQIFVKQTGENLKSAISSISKPIVKTLIDFGIKVDCKTEDKRNLHSDFCAETQTFGEISVGGKKLVASSQVYTPQGILQHGTIPITADYRRICDYFEGDCEEVREFLRRNTTYLDEICNDFKAESFIMALARNFEELAKNLSQSGVSLDL